MARRDPDIYKALLDNLSDGVMVIDFDGTVKVANPALCRMFGLDAGQVVGCLFREIFMAFEGFDDFVQIIFDAVVGQGDIERRVTSVSIDDRILSLSVTTSYLTTVRDGQTERVAVIAVASDITQVKELRESEVRMAKVVESQLVELQEAYRDLEARNEALFLMKKRVQVARVAAALLVAGLFLAIGAWYFRPLDVSEARTDAQQPVVEMDDPRTLSSLVVEPGEFRSTLVLRGRLAPDRTVKIVSPVESHVSEVYVNYGQRVAAGDPLVDFDSTQLNADYRRAQVGYIQASDRLAELRDWEASAEVASARRALRRARIALEDAQRNLRQTAFLLDQGIVPVADHEQAQQRHRERELDLEETARELDAVMAQGSEEARQVAELEVENAREHLQEQREKLEMVPVRAPLAGLIIAVKNPEYKPLARGRPVSQGEVLLNVVGFEHIQVVTSVDEVDVRKLRRGQRALITGPGFPGLSLGGAVTEVSAQANARSQLRDTPRFRIVVTLDALAANNRERLRVGMSAHVEIVVHSRSDALLVPIEAVEQSGGKTWLFVIDRDADMVEKRAVELGSTTIDAVEVTAGLAAGEEIVRSRR